MFKKSLFCRWKRSGSVVLAKNVTLSFADSILSGDIVYDRGRQELTMVSNTYWQEVSWYLSTSLWPRGLAPKRGRVFIKDWDEDAGLTDALVALGVVKTVATHDSGFFGERLCEVRVVF